MDKTKKVWLICALLGTTTLMPSAQRGQLGFGVGTDKGIPYAIVTPDTVYTVFLTPSILLFPHLAIRWAPGSIFLEPNLTFGFDKEKDEIADVSTSHFALGIGIKAGIDKAISEKALFYPFAGFDFQLHKSSTTEVEGTISTTESISIFGISIPFGIGLEYFFLKGFSADISVKFPLIELFKTSEVVKAGNVSEDTQKLSTLRFLKIGLTNFRLAFFFYL